jgi:hypothetical protein
MPLASFEQPKDENSKEIEILAKMEISVMSDGSTRLNIPEDGRQLSTEEIEVIARNVYEQLRDIRIATKAVELFKQRLG